MTGRPQVYSLSDNGYDEFGLLHENAAEWGIAFHGAPTLQRVVVELTAGDWVSGIRWGDGDPEVVFLHGGGQNAHTWDTVALALGRPALALDLPGHGHSYRRADRNYGPWANAEAMATAMSVLAPGADVVIGMSLGGATLLHLAAAHPHLCRRVVVVDVTPQINDPSREMTTMERGSVALIGGPPTYDSFEAMAEATVALSPHRAPEGVRRGVRHNAYQRDDGKWTWRYDLFGPRPAVDEARDWSDFTPLWDDVSAITAPIMLVRGGLSKYVRDDDVAELLRRRPDARIEVVDGAGHAVQSDRPLELVRLVDDFAPRRRG